MENVLPGLVEGYEPNCVYNADESGLFFKILPEYTLNVSSERAHGNVKPKDRITVLFCCNADGSHKIVPYVIGSAKQPRCFSGIYILC